MSAEKGSTVRFLLGGATVHTLTASGEKQDAIFKLEDGRHEIAVTAMDAAGNTSKVANVKTVIDTTPPDAPVLKVKPGAKAGALTAITLVGEKASSYRLTVEGTSSESGHGKLDGKGEATAEWLLANGDYTATATLTDAAGNRSKVGEAEFTVALPAPARPAVDIVSDPGTSPVVVAVSGLAGDTVTVTVLGEGATKEAAVELDRRGKGTVSFEVPDSRYTVEAVSTDFQGQQSTAAHHGDVVVKTTPPTLAVALIEDLLSTGLFAYQLQAEPGAMVRVTSATDGLITEFTADGKLSDYSFEVPRGEHAVTIAVIDAFGNETVQELAASVSAPLGLGGWVVMLALLGGAAFGIFRGIQWATRRRSGQPESQLGGGWPPAAA